MGQNILICSHGNCLRAIVKLMTHMNRDSIMSYNIPTGVPILFEFDNELKVIKQSFMAPKDVVSQRIRDMVKANKLAMENRK